MKEKYYVEQVDEAAIMSAHSELRILKVVPWYVDWFCSVEKHTVYNFGEFCDFPDLLPIEVREEEIQRYEEAKAKAKRYCNILNKLFPATRLPK